jgi:hypothetical protein
MREAARVNKITGISIFHGGLTAPIGGSVPFAMGPAILQT